MPDTQSFTIVRVDSATASRIEDTVVVEEPLEIRVNNSSLGVTMRTPGDDFDLAFGLLWTEGLIHSAQDVGTIAYCPDEHDPGLKNVLNATLVDKEVRITSNRTAWASSSCGLCGKSTIDAIRQKSRRIRSAVAIEYDTLIELPDRMRAHQVNFNRTGGIHAAGLFDMSGKLLLLREDLGRHNAVDKVLGAALRANVPIGDLVLLVSGRLGFEIAQKAAVAGVPVVASVSAPSSLAIDLAQEIGMTAVGFVRNRSVNIYSHPQRIINGISKHSDRNRESHSNPHD